MARMEKNLASASRIVIGDSASMDELADCSVQLVVTSPPYPMIKMWDGLFSDMDERIRVGLASGNRESLREAYMRMHAKLALTFSECARVLIDGGICCVNIGDAARTSRGRFQVFPNHVDLTRTLECCGLDILPYILWKKPMNRPNAFLGSGFLPTNAYVTLDCEFILIARKGGLRKFAPKDPKRYGSSFTKGERDRWFSQIWDDVRGACQNVAERGDRTGAFPAEIPRRLIRMFSIEGDTVLDPFMGTGTTLLECAKLNRRFMGYEVNEKAISSKVLGMVGKDLGLMRRNR